MPYSITIYAKTIENRNKPIFGYPVQFVLFFSSRTGMEFVQGADVTPDSQPIRKVSLAPYKFQPQFAAVIRQGDILEDYYFFIKQKYSTRASFMAKTESERRVSMIYYLTSKSLTSNQLII